MPSKTLSQRIQTDRPQEAKVLPFSRERLGRGARITAGSRELAERQQQGSPVYFPGDPRLHDA